MPGGRPGISNPARGAIRPPVVRVAFARRGHGIGLLPSTYCDEAIAKGKLIRLLSQWTSPRISLFAAYPSRKFLPLRLSLFLQALADWKSPLWIKD